MLRKKWPLALAALAILVAVAVALFPRSREVDTVALRRGELVQSVVATGRVATPARIEIASQFAARIDAVEVREGDPVAAGQPLVRLVDDDAKAALASARAAASEAEKRLVQLAAVQRPVSVQQLAQAEAILRSAEQDLARNRDLLAKGFVSQARVDESERALAVARAAAAGARAQAEATREGGADVELARARLAQARAGVESAQARLDLTVLRAPADATVLARLAEPGDTAQVGRPLLTLAQRGETRIYATVDEKNLALIAPGQKASALADAYPGRPFEATLYYVAPAVDAQRATVEIRLRVDRPPAFLKPDMTVSVQMVTGRRESALLAPAEAVRGDGGRRWLLAVRDGRAVELPVKTGLAGVGVVEILEGASEGDLAVLPGTPALPGDRVRTRAPRGKAGFQGMPGFTN